MGYGRDQFQERVDENLICPICHKVLQDPLQCQDGHLFCRGCITEWLKTNQKCPVDNKPLQANNLAHGLFVKNMLYDLNVYCQPPAGCVGAGQQTCDWTGKLHSLAEHRKTCPFQQVRCFHVNCNKVMQRRELEDHDKVCKFKTVWCEKCNKIFVRHELQTHKDVECLEVVVPCPNGCTNSQGQTKLKRVYLGNHLTSICAKTVVDCPFKDQGCSVQVERQDVEKHVQFNMAAHMMLLAKQCSFLIKQNSSLTEQNSSLAGQCSSLTKENQALKDELQEVKAHLSSTNTYTWIIYDFPALCHKHSNGSRLKSPTFWLCGYKLGLEIYPNGINTDVSGFISLYLNVHEEYPDTPRRVTKVPNSESAIKFRMSLISQMPYTQDVSFDETHVFKEQKGRGWPKFMKTTDALSADYCNSTNGSVTITCTILLDKP